LRKKREGKKGNGGNGEIEMEHEQLKQTPDHNHGQPLPNLLAVVGYLQDRGWKTTKLTAGEMINLVQGDPLKASYRIYYLLAQLEIWLGRYAENREFKIHATSNSIR
jgi:hypothetical protein